MHVAYLLISTYLTYKKRPKCVHKRLKKKNPQKTKQARSKSFQKNHDTVTMENCQLSDGLT